jgi:hypothetical protein
MQHVPISRSSNPSSKGYGLCSVLPIASNDAIFPRLSATETGTGSKPFENSDKR